MNRDRRTSVGAYGILYDGTAGILLVKGANDVWTLPGDTVPHGAIPAAFVLDSIRDHTGLIPVMDELVTVETHVSDEGSADNVYHVNLLYRIRQFSGEMDSARAAWFSYLEMDTLSLDEVALHAVNWMFRSAAGSYGFGAR